MTPQSPWATGVPSSAWTVSANCVPPTGVVSSSRPTAASPRPGGTHADAEQPRRREHRGRSAVQDGGVEDEQVRRVADAQEPGRRQVPHEAVERRPFDRVQRRRVGRGRRREPDARERAGGIQHEQVARAGRGRVVAGDPVTVGDRREAEARLRRDDRVGRSRQGREDAQLVGGRERGDDPPRGDGDRRLLRLQRRLEHERAEAAAAEAVGGREPHVRGGRRVGEQRQ